MIKVLWRPAESRPQNAAALEAAIEQTVSRDVSARVASVLDDHDCPARTFARV